MLEPLYQRFDLAGTGILVLPCAFMTQAGLVSNRRRGKMVLYQRTRAASALLEAVRSHKATG